MTGPEPAGQDPPQYRAAGPCTMVIFGAAGDLTKRKLLPALHNLRRGGLLKDEFGVVAVARTDVDGTVAVVANGDRLRVQSLP